MGMSELSGLIGRFAVVWVFVSSLSGCTAGGGTDTAATGGMSGTGISQGAIDSFGSVFVNGIQWNIGSASVELDGTSGAESDLRVGMVVRLEGDFVVTGTTGTATSVVFDDAIEGPIESAPVDFGATGLEKTFEILGTTIVMHELDTVFASGAGFASLSVDDVVEVSGFVDETGAIRATRIEGKGSFPAISFVELRGNVVNLITDANGTGSFDLGGNLVRYTAATTFDDVTPATLANGDLVEVEGQLRLSGTEIDASRVEKETPGFGNGDAEEAEVEGIVSERVSDTRFRVAGILIDATNAVFDPVGFVVMDGELVEVEGSLEGGVLIAERVESEEIAEDVRIEAAVVATNPGARTLEILGVTVSADPSTRIEDDRDDDPNFGFAAIQPGDWLEIRGVQTGPGAVLATEIERESDGDDVILEGPVTFLDVDAPAISILDQSIPLDGGTLYFDDAEAERSEEEFFRNPGDVMLGDVVRATDISAALLDVLGEADEVAIEDD